MKTRWVVLDCPWWQGKASAIPFLMDQGDSFEVVRPDEYLGPLLHERDVVVGPHRAPMLAEVFEKHAERVTLYETENLLGSASWRARSADIRNRCPSVPWLNYSARNAEVFGDTPRPLRRLPEGQYESPRPSAGGGADVLFVGSMNSRRAWILSALAAAGYSVHVPAKPVFGEDLASLETSSRLVLNIHYYMPGIFESFRVVPAVHRGAQILSEISEAGEGEEWCECVPYDRLVSRAVEILKQSTQTPHRSVKTA